MENTLNKTLIVFLVLIFAGLLYFLAPVLTPFLAATLIAYLLNPIIEKMTRLHIPRTLNVAIVFVIFIVMMVFIFLSVIPLIEKQIEYFAYYIPAVLTWFQEKIIPWFNTNFGTNETINIATLKTTLEENWTKTGGIATAVLKTVLKSSFTLITWMANLILIPVVTFYLLRDWKLVLNNARSLLPRSIEPTVVKLAKESDSVLSEFFRGELLVMLSLGIIYSVGLTVVGLQVGIIIGLLSGLLSIVPYLGFIVGIISASVAAYFQFGTFTAVVSVWVVYAIGQAMEGMVLTPKLVGHRIGLHPVAVIFSVLTGGYLFGFFGVLLALPVAAVIMVLLRFITHRYQHSRLYKA